MKRLLIFLGALALGTTVGACFDEDLTLDLDCQSADECAPSQTCFRTPHQEALGLDGWCRPEAACAEGSQPGCECTANLGCSTRDFEDPALSPVVEACLAADDVDQCEVDNGVAELGDCFCKATPTAP